MIKIDFAKISFDDFIRKYNMKPQIMFSGCRPYKWSIGSEIHAYPNSGEISVSTEGAGESVYAPELEILFDMIENGDVIKEESK